MGEEIKILYSKREEKKGAVLKVLGVGGAGGNAIKRMIEAKLRGVEFIAVNTDLQALGTVPTPSVHLQIGEKLTRGLGVGSNPDAGEQAALEDTDRIIEAMDGANMVFITAGMGGGTGTGASPVIANHASSMGILTVAVVTKPFQFEKEKRMRTAEDGIRKLRESVDALIVIPNQRLLELGDPDLTLREAYRRADDVLLQAVRGISDIINSTGEQNVDFADVKATMLGKGMTLMGTGEAKGENRAEEATHKALHSPLLDNLTIDGATGILYNITAGPNLKLSEIEKISEMITGNADPDAVIKFGVIEDENMGEGLRVTVVATGFSAERPAQQQAAARATPASSFKKESPQRQPTPPHNFLSKGRHSPASVDITGYISEASLPSMAQSSEDFADPLDIPTFQRQSLSKRK